MPPQNIVDIRMEEGKPTLIVVRADGIIERTELRPVQLLTLIHGAGKIAWSHFDLKDRK